MKHEIEVKARVKDVGVLISKLKEIGCVLSAPIIQDDYIYNQKGLNLKDHSHNTPVLRIRKQGKRVIFTVKKNRSGELDCIEKEIDVSDENILKDIIELLGFEKTIEVHKKRMKGDYKGYEICVDEVKGLGSFIEVEKMSDEDGEKVQNELFDFLKKLGISKENRVFIGYDSQIWLKNNKE
ncbi:MAG: class IV adenylate cyclase [Candidatus Paceibacterota bacterium]